jgi:hypothetical protein
MSTWRDTANCKDVPDPEIFFPLPQADTSEALAYCGACIVRVECLQSALDSGDDHSIAGGLTATERRQKLQEGQLAHAPAGQQPTAFRIRADYDPVNINRRYPTGTLQPNPANQDTPPEPPYSDLIGLAATATALQLTHA